MATSLDVAARTTSRLMGQELVQVEWRPPTKNADRIERYKLMMATTSGVVKEITQGRFLRYFVSGLRPASEYIFCVKALYADGSSLWSESKSFHTASR